MVMIVAGQAVNAFWDSKHNAIGAEALLTCTDDRDVTTSANLEIRTPDGQLCLTWNSADPGNCAKHGICDTGVTSRFLATCPADPLSGAMSTTLSINSINRVDFGYWSCMSEVDDDLQGYNPGLYTYGEYDV